MKKAIVFVRITLGILFLFASISFFLKLVPEPELKGNLKTFLLGLEAAVYLLPLVKIIELICGLAYITGRYITIANILILPITINILFVNFFLSPENMPIALFIFIGNLFLIFSCWKNYKELFVL